MKITAYSAAINSLLTTPSGQLGMGSRHPDLEIDQAYMFEARSSGDINLNLLSGVGVVDDAEVIIGGDGVTLNGDQIALSQVYQIHIRNTGDSEILATVSIDDGQYLFSDAPISPGGEVAFFSQVEVSEAVLELVDRDGRELIGAKVFVSGKQ